MKVEIPNHLLKVLLALVSSRLDWARAHFKEGAYRDRLTELEGILVPCVYPSEKDQD